MARCYVPALFGAVVMAVSSGFPTAHAPTQFMVAENTVPPAPVEPTPGPRLAPGWERSLTTLMGLPFRKFDPKKVFKLEVSPGDLRRFPTVVVRPDPSVQYSVIVVEPDHEVKYTMPVIAPGEAVLSPDKRNRQFRFDWQSYGGPAASEDGDERVEPPLPAPEAPETEDGD